MVDLKRVAEVVKTNQDPLPPDLYKPKGKLALAFVVLSMEVGMDLGDMADIRQVIFWDNNRFEIHVYPRVSQAKRAKWRAALDRPVSLNSTLRRLSK